MNPRHLVILLIPLLLAGAVQAETLRHLNLTRSQLQRIITCNLATGWYCSRLIMHEQKPAASNH
ncbi:MULTISPECIES: hypothetical protein [unclassified Paludibacterium]|uniref:hypothetical protein n=1 Tax=unclassified Paludibacterium TaxID=2618429 RepID=UPI001C04B8F1|nr:hypothetical protein [Paludibacterium sp. B53371]